MPDIARGDEDTVRMVIPVCVTRQHNLLRHFSIVVLHDLNCFVIVIVH